MQIHILNYTLFNYKLFSFSLSFMFHLRNYTNTEFWKYVTIRLYYLWNFISECRQCNKNYHRKVELGLREQKIRDLEQCCTVTHTTHTQKKYFINTRPKTNPRDSDRWDRSRFWITFNRCEASIWSWGWKTTELN